MSWEVFIKCGVTNFGVKIMFIEFGLLIKGCRTLFETGSLFQENMVRLGQVFCFDGCS